MEEKPITLGLNRNVFFAGLVSLFMDISSEMIYPLLPLFLTSVLGASKTTVGVIEGIAEGTASILKVFSGWLSDKFGKKKLLMGAGYGISALSRPIIAGSATWAEVLGARFMDRFGKGVRTAPRDAIIADSTEKGKLGFAFGFHRAMDTIGAVIGPAIAFLMLYVLSENLRFVFLVSTIPAIIAVILISIFITEKKRAKKDIAGVPRPGIADFNGPFRLYIIVIAIFSLGSFADAFLVLRAENLGVQRKLIPIIYLIYNIIYASTSTPLGALADRVGKKNMVMAGFLYFSVILALVAISTKEFNIWILFPLFGVYKGMGDGTQRAYLASLAPGDRKATAFGIYHMVTGVTLLPANIIAGYLWDRSGPQSTFLYGSVMALIALIIFAFFSRTEKRPLLMINSG